MPRLTSALAASRDVAGAWDGTLPPDLHELVQEWAASPSTHPQLGDWRRVGYRRGASEPAPAPAAPVVSASSLGVAPDSSGDVSVPLQRALDDLGAAGGGILQLDPGRYQLDFPLFVHHSNVVVRGAGKHETTLYFTRPLMESIGGGVEWSWTGGQIFFVPKAVRVSSGETWLGGQQLAVVAPAARGSQVLEVSDTSSLVPGSMVLLEVSDSDVPEYRLLCEMAGDVIGTKTFPWATTQVNGAKLRWPVIVTRVLSTTTVEIEQPLRITIHPQTPARLVELGPTLHDSGVEGLTIENDLRPQTAHNVNPGSNGVCFQAVYDCWATDIHAVNCDVAFSMTSAKSCTLTGISAGGRALHHFTISRAQSHDNLIQGFELEDFTIPTVQGAFLHGISTENLSSGNVWRRGVLHTGTFDSHRAMPFENLRTDIVLVNKDGVPGGAPTAGPQFGARWAHWGYTVTSGNTLCMDISDVAPRSIVAGQVGCTQTGSQLQNIPPGPLGSYFVGPLESRLLQFGVDLGSGRDLLEIQRTVAPVGA
jgi:hypothetical protein